MSFAITFVTTLVAAEAAYRLAVRLLHRQRKDHR